uniref:IRS-type PTB domain-containing protein n=1 Tax=Leptobrachium leishanense TaxID=445787 RepID=A0A8C5PVA3_9ANUR
MGLCLSSKSKLAATENERRFKVINVNDDGKRICPGVMELTDTYLIFHLQKGGIVKWPYICLLKYGFNSNLFSFVCGKRCQTGEGIFGFRCNRAEEFFNMLQRFMQNNRISIISDGDCEGSITSQPTLYRYEDCPFLPGHLSLLPTSKRPEPIGSELPQTSESATAQVPQSSMSTAYKADQVRLRSSRTLEREIYDSGISQTSSIHSYDEVPLDYSELRTCQKSKCVFQNHMNKELENSESIAYTGVDCRVLSCIRRMGYENIRALHSEGSKSIISVDSNSDSQITNCVTTLYAAGTGSHPSSPSLFEKQSLEQKSSPVPRTYRLQYSYPDRLSFGQDHEETVACLNFDVRPPSQELRKLNYIDIESSCDSDNPQTPLSPVTSVSVATDLRSKPYAELDLEKTAALSLVQQQRSNYVGTRKTRHNGRHFPV